MGKPQTPKTIRSLFDTAVRHSHGRIAVEYIVNGIRKSISYGELGKQVRNVAELFESLSIRPRQQPVALILENGPDWVVDYLALNGSAITVVPMDPKLKAPEVLYILKNAGCCAVITDSAHIPLLETVLPDLPEIRDIILHCGDDSVAPSSICGKNTLAIDERLPILKYTAWSDKGRYATTEPGEEDIAAIIYTSGSTGKPKGAMITNLNFYSDAEGTLAGVKVLRKRDRFLVVLPLFHAFSFLTNMILSLKLQARLQFVVSLRTISEDFKRYHPTVMMAVPLLVEKIATKIDNGIRTNRLMLLFQAFHLRGLVKHLILRSLGGALRMIVVGGAPCSTKVITTMRRFGIHVLEGYGLTEASPVVSIAPPNATKIGTIGLPLPNIDVKIDSPDNHGIGELLVKGPIVMKGYLNMPEATAEVLEGGWLHTGDLATQDEDGFLTIRGRKKALIVNREGKNIYPEEVEQCIARDSAIRDILVLGYHDQQEIGEKVGAIVVPNMECFKNADGTPLPQEEIEARVRGIVHAECSNLATYKHPRKLDIRYEPLQRTAALKIQRKLYQGELDR